MGKIYALLDKNLTAREVFAEAGKQAASTLPVVRGIIDKNLGYISLGTSRPEDTLQERVILIETPDPRGVAGELVFIPGIRSVASSLSALTA